MINNNIPHYQQTGISAFTSEFLSTYTNLPKTPLEKIESIDFLRIFEHGHKIRSVITDEEIFGVDMLEDIKKCEKILQNDDLQGIMKQ